MSKLAPITDEDEWFQGETKLLTFTVETEEENGTPEVISGWTIQWMLMGHKKAQSSIFTKETGGSGVVITDGLNGLVEVTIDPGDTTGVEPRTYWHELWRTDAGFEAVLSYGPAELL